MLTLPKIEKITKDATVTHLLLMSGYKLFSLYFPLFLVTKNFSIAQVGYTNFLIYLPIAVFAPFIGFLNRKINSATLASAGILGYGIYSLGMILFQNLFVFYIFQIILGISASLFFVSSRAMLMKAKLENPDRAFAWFYSAPTYADAFAPAIGALLIWKFGFNGVFILSLIIQIFTAGFCFIRLKKQISPALGDIGIRESNGNYLKVLGKIKERQILPFISTSFLVLILAGFNNTFFVLFLRNLGWSQNKILFFSSILSLVFLPVSFWIIKRVAKFKSEINISRGSQIAGLFSILLGMLFNFLNFYLMFFITLGSYIGGLMTNSGRSGFLTKKIKNYPEEIGAIDTIFSPLAMAFGSLVGGFLIGIFGFPLIFTGFGSLIFSAGFLGGRFVKKEKIG